MRPAPNASPTVPLACRLHFVLRQDEPLAAEPGSSRRTRASGIRDHRRNCTHRDAHLHAPRTNTRNTRGRLRERGR